MKYKILFFVWSFSISALSFAQTCEWQYQKIQSEVHQRYDVLAMRKITQNIFKLMSAAEKKEMIAMADRFKSIPHDTTENQNERYALQKQARSMVRALVTRAGYRISNPEEGSPYDAVIGVRVSSDGYTDYTIEVRSLLVLDNPFPHITLWMSRWDPAHNARLLISLSITNEAKDDYASWRPDPNASRVVGSFSQFIKSFLPKECQ